MKYLFAALALCLLTIPASGRVYAKPSHGGPSGTTAVGPKAYYLALGDSLAYGYQPNFDFSHGYANDFYNDLHTRGTSSLTNLACPGETTATFINGGCPYSWMRKVFYTGSQLSAAVNFIKGHAAKVSPVTIDIGANDVLPEINSSTCTISSNWQSTLDSFNSHFTTILQKLSSALNGSGDLIVMNYYDPYQNKCASNPDVMNDLQVFNGDIASDAASYGAHVADVFGAYGGTTTSNICTYTWMCSSYSDIHPTSTGYQVIANAFESAAGY